MIQITTHFKHNKTVMGGGFFLLANYKYPYLEFSLSPPSMLTETHVVVVGSRHMQKR